MWQLHLLCLFTNSHGDLINPGGGEQSTQRLPNARVTACKNQIPVHLPLVFLMLVFGSF